MNEYSVHFIDSDGYARHHATVSADGVLIKDGCLKLYTETDNKDGDELEVKPRTIIRYYPVISTVIKKK